jgi:hypothetical protein
MIGDSSQGLMSRRALLLGAALSGAWHAFAIPADKLKIQTNAQQKLKICVFSKHFQWTNVKEAAAIARDIGFDGVDLTVRADGHVLPEQVESDLPKAVEIVRNAGLEVPMITTGIATATSRRGHPEDGQPIGHSPISMGRFDVSGGQEHHGTARRDQAADERAGQP